MARLSISKAWDETKVVIAQSGNLIVAVGLALLVLPGVVAGLVQPQPTPGELPPAGPWMALMLAALLIGMVGQLAIVRLALGSGVSVGEALAHAARRFLPFLGAVLLVIIPFLILVSVLAAMIGTDPEQANAAATLVLLLVLIGMIYVLIRLLLMAPVATAESIGPVEIVKRSWQLTRGNWWRLFAFFLLLIIAGSILVLAVGTIMGTIVGLVSDGTIEPMSVGALVVGLVTQVVATALTIVFMVMLARMYLQVAGGHAHVSVPSSAD